MLSIKSRLGWRGVCCLLVMSKKRECRQVVTGSDKSGWRGECVLSRFSHVHLFCSPMDYSPSGSSVYRDSSGKNTGVGCYPFLQRIVPGIKLMSLKSPALAGGFFTTSATWRGEFWIGNMLLQIYL